MVRVHALSMAAALVALCACAGDPAAATQLILVVDTDVDLIETIVFRVEAAGVPEKTATAARSGSGEPTYLTLLREQGPLGPLTVSARGLRGETTLISRTHVVSFVEGQTLVVPLHLAQSCILRSCDDQTCGELGCVPRELDAESLLPWSGAPPQLGSGSAIGQCGPDTMVDLMTDPAHCGACHAKCSTGPAMRNTVATCSNGSCTVACMPQTEDCNGRTSDGCEASLRDDPKHCGACNNGCKGNETCRDGVCDRK